MKNKLLDMTGKQFNGCIVLKRNGSDKYRKACWLVKCHCGKEFTTLGASIRNGHVNSCGCSRNKTRVDMGNANKTHGETRTRLYVILKNMKARCYNENHKSYKYYGAEGITICDEWKNDYTVFRDWAYENGYSDELTIDRINVAGNYEPSNCRWVTHKEQSINKRSNKFLSYQNEILTQSQICERTGLSKYMVNKLYNKEEDL